MNKKIRQLVVQRADNICEYCRLWQEFEPFQRFQVEHILPKKHGGQGELDNLALACIWCNLHKSSDLTGIDPFTEEITRLFHPRKDKWEDHFHWKGIVQVGNTPIGRTTVVVLAVNHADRSVLKETLLKFGQWPY